MGPLLRRERDREVHFMPVSTKGFTGQVMSQRLRKALHQWDLWVPEVWSALVGNDGHSEVRNGWGN